MTGNALFGLLPTLSSLFGGGGRVLFHFCVCLFLKSYFCYDEVILTVQSASF